MFFFPYRAQIKLHKTPVVTIAVAILCLAIYYAQDRNWEAIVSHAESVCAALPSEGQGTVTSEGYRTGRSFLSCEEAVLYVHQHPDPESFLAELVEEARASGHAPAAARLEGQYRAFARHTPAHLSTRLAHDRSRFDPLGMLTSAFAHASWQHVIFNLIAFFAFAAAVELIFGQALFAGVIIVLAYAIGLFDFVVSQLKDSTEQSLGLSGVVMGMLALFIYFLPGARIRVFFWFLFTIGTVGVPAWLLGTWYIGWDLYYELSQTEGYINFVAHLAGAGFGFLIGALVFSHKRQWARDIVLERVDLTQDEPWIAKLNAIATAPVVAGLGFLVSTSIIVLLLSIVRDHWGLLLAATPPIAAAYYIHRSRQADQPLRGRYQLGLEVIEANDYDQAIKYLEPLAERNDTRALFALGQMYEGGPGTWRDQARAIALYTRAADRGHAQAQYQLGRMYADGRGVAPNMTKALERYEQAARAGLPDAANTLGYLYEGGIGVPEDREKAIDWYYRAGVGYQKARRRDDAQAVIRHLEGLAAKYPAVLALTQQLKRRVV